MRHSRRVAWLLALCAAVPVQAEMKEPWSLDQAVPDGAFFYVHSIENPKNAFLDEYWGEVFEALERVNLLGEIKNLILAGKEADEVAQAEAVLTRLTELCHGVDWWSLIGREFVYAWRMDMPSPSHLFICRVPPEEQEKNLEGLRAILAAIAALDDEAHPEGTTPPSQGALRVVESTRGKVRLWSLSVPDNVFQFSIGAADDVIIAGIGQPNGLFDQALGLINGGEGVKRLIDRPDFKEAFGSLPRAETERMFVSVTAFCDQLDGAVTFFERMVAGQTKAEGETVPAYTRPDAIFRAIHRAVDHLRFVDWVASVSSTEGYSTKSTTLTKLLPNAQDKPFARAIFRTRQLDDFGKYVPQEATSFSVSVGIDVQGLYQAVLGYFRNDLAGGEELLAKWDGLQAQIGFNIENDLLSWVDGETISVSMPPATPSPFGGSDSVMFVRVRDEAKARAKIDGWIAKLNELLTSKNQALLIQPAVSPTLEGFTTVTHPMVAMFLRPVYGMRDGYLVFGTSEPAIKRCLETAAGTRASITASARFRKEGLSPKDKFTSVSFSDTSNMGQELAQVFGMTGMWSTFMPQTKETEGARVMFGLMQKLAPVVAQLDFFQSEASVTTLEDGAYRTVMVTNYKEPAPKTEPAGEPAAAEPVQQAADAK